MPQGYKQGFQFSLNGERYVVWLVSTQDAPDPPNKRNIYTIAELLPGFDEVKTVHYATINGTPRYALVGLNPNSHFVLRETWSPAKGAVVDELQLVLSGQLKLELFATPKRNYVQYAKPIHRDHKVRSDSPDSSNTSVTSPSPSSKPILRKKTHV
jgi:hypothetical protein